VLVQRIGNLVAGWQMNLSSDKNGNILYSLGATFLSMGVVTTSDHECSGRSEVSVGMVQEFGPEIAAALGGVRPVTMLQVGSVSLYVVLMRTARDTHCFETSRSLRVHRA